MKKPVRLSPAATVLTLVLVIAIPIVLNLGSGPVRAGPAPETPTPKTARLDRRVILIADPGPANRSFTPPPRSYTGLHAQTSTFAINWRSDGSCTPWPADARAAFEYAVSIWESIVSSPVTVEIDACWEDLTARYGPGVLGAARAADHVYNYANAPYADTWYPIALANALAGTDLSTYADIDASFNSTFDAWYFGTDHNTPIDRYNLATVVLHEICHGLGFYPSFAKHEFLAGAYWGAAGMPLVFDHFVENSIGENLVAKYPSATSLYKSSAALLDELTSDNVFFDGANANAADGGSRPRLYAPTTWSSGSSIAHLDEQYNSSTDNRLMTYSLSRGETTYDPGPIVTGIFQDIGWTIQTGSAEPEPIPEPVSTAIPISGGVISITYQTTTTVTFPAGAVGDPISVTLALTETGIVTPNLGTIGMAFTLQAVRVWDGSPVGQFARMVNITIDYDDADVWDTVEGTMALAYLDNGNWIPATTTCSPATTPLHDLDRNTFSLDICRWPPALGKFALLAETHRSYMPIFARNATDW